MPTAGHIRMEREEEKHGEYELKVKTLCSKKETGWNLNSSQGERKK